MEEVGGVMSVVFHWTIALDHSTTASFLDDTKYLTGGRGCNPLVLLTRREVSLTGALPPFHLFVGRVQAPVHRRHVARVSVDMGGSGGVQRREIPNRVVQAAIIARKNKGTKGTV